MNTAERFARPSALLALGFALTLTGCKTTAPAPDDAALNAQVQSRLASDPNLSGQSVQASVASGVVTLSGTVTSDTARTIASGDAGQLPGVKTVINNLLVQAPPPSATARTSRPAPIAPAAPGKSRQPPVLLSRQPTPAPIVRNVPPPPSQPESQSQPAPEPTFAQAPPPPPPPPAPVAHNITLPSGTDIPVRITQTLDSASTQQGDKFTGAVASDIVVDGLVVLAQGTPVTGHVDAVQDAAHFKGSALLTISLSAINRKGEHITVSSEPYTKQGEGRGKNTAEKVGGGAAVGAILGGILGGGRGAAIGSAAGAGVGAGAQGVTRGQQVQIPSETVIRFKLSDPVLVHVTSPPNQSGNSPALERHDQ